MPAELAARSRARLSGYEGTHRAHWQGEALGGRFTSGARPV
ncbi:hypothetical protein D187_005542 [Cystobacter fuscus DSM 2262]|uniref:Uncharacterized protein n=1 Tax=Cystobacter fuscus (strain ATCC 25194 / DSM 2262 / NBRC 100088 / M29) TaxID=1242864 RepID=S9R5Z4_CYSF2|nr:hypothetical protein D187_005542 [Cystobacter fuscus DSM 2262]